MATSGRKRTDRFFSFDELPEAERAQHDWADDDTQFVRVIYKNGRKEFIPLENFTRLASGKSPSGKPCDGFATDSYFSGTAIRLLQGREKYAKGDMDYEVWPEHW